VQIGRLVQKSGQGKHTVTQKQHANLISPLSFLREGKLAKIKEVYDQFLQQNTELVKGRVDGPYVGIFQY
jgi:hypothetical protein